jgi:hypothetical protein
MKIYQIISILVIAAMSFTSCEEIIELDLENAEPKLVIEANVDVTNQTATVFLTKSNGFYDDISLNVITDATVNLTLADGSILNLPMISDGFYAAFGINAAEGDELVMSVVDGDEKVYEATENVPHEVALDSLEFIARTGGFGLGGGDADTTYQVFVHWQDVADKESFYRIRSILNDTLQTGTYSLADDIGFDGTAFSTPLFSFFETGDTVTIQILSIDDGSFRYFSDLSAAQGQGFGSTTPYNPKSNFDNNALGYFGISRTDEETVIMK